MKRKSSNLRIAKKMISVVAIISVIISALGITAGAWPSADGLTDGLVGHWKLNEQHVYIGEQTKESIFNGDSNYWGNTTLTKADNNDQRQIAKTGVIGQAMNPSSGGYSYYITDQIPKAELDKNGEMTIALWVKTPEQLSTGEAWVYGIGSNANTFTYNLECDAVNGLVWQLRMYKSDSSMKFDSSAYSQTSIRLIDKDILKTNTWYHVALKLKRNHGNGVYFIGEGYLNGERIDRSRLVIFDTSNIGGLNTFFPGEDTDKWQMIIGAGHRYKGAAATKFMGMIDDVRVYNTAGDGENPPDYWKVWFREGTGVDIASLYNMKDNLIGSWSLNGNIDETVFSGNERYWGNTVLGGRGSEFKNGRNGKKAFSPNGTGYILTDTIPSYELTYNNNLGISLWVKTPDIYDFESTQTIMSINAPNSDVVRATLVYAKGDDGKYYFRWISKYPENNQIDPAVQVMYNLNIGPVNPGTWYQVGLSGFYNRNSYRHSYIMYRGLLNGKLADNGRFSPYLDLYKDNAALYLPDNIFAAGSQLCIGATVPGTTVSDIVFGGFKGLISDVNIYNDIGLAGDIGDTSVFITDTFKRLYEDGGDRIYVSGITKNDDAISSLKIRNESSNTLNGKVIAAVYSDNGSLLENIAVADVTSLEKGNEAEITFGTQITSDNSMLLKLFLLSDMNDIRPITGYEVYSEGK